MLAERHGAPFTCKGEHSGLNKEKAHAEVAEICGQNGSAVVKSGRTKIRASFAVAPQTAKVTATVRDTCLVKMEKAFSLWAEDTNRKQRVAPERIEPVPGLQQGARPPRSVTPNHAPPVRGADSRVGLALCRPTASQEREG